MALNFHSINYSKTNFDSALLLLRVSLGASMAIGFGLEKLRNFDTMKIDFMSFLGLSPAYSLGLVVFAELFCASLIVLGLFTRLATIPLIVVMAVATFMAHNGDIFDTARLPFLFLTGFLAILLLGPAEFSADALFQQMKHGKRRRRR